MPIKFKCRIDGLSSTLKKIENYKKKLGDDIDEELTIAVKNIESVAQLNAPKGKTGRLGASVYSSSAVKYSKEVGVLAPYSPYVEFGTGSRVFDSKNGFAFTPEMREFAREFYVNGMGKMPARPFLFPAYEAEKQKLIGRIRRILTGV